MKKISSVIANPKGSNEDFFNKKLKVAMANYREAKTREKKESWEDWADRFEDFGTSKEYGSDYILGLRGNGIDTEKKVKRRTIIFNNFYAKMFDIRDNEILDSMARKSKEAPEVWEKRINRILNKNNTYIFEQRDNFKETTAQYQKRVSKFTRLLAIVECNKTSEDTIYMYEKKLDRNIESLNNKHKEKLRKLKDDQKKKIEDVKQSKVDDAFNKIKSKHDFEKKLADDDKANEEKKQDDNEKALYDEKLFKAFLIFIGIVFICLFLKLYFVSSIIGYVSFMVFLSLIIFFANSDDFYNKVNNNEWYRMIMTIVFKFSSLTSKVLKAAGHTTIRK